MTYRAAWGLAVLCLFVAPAGLSNAQDVDPRVVPYRMTQAGLEQILHEISAEAEGRGGVVEFVHDGLFMVCISDTLYDRMRLIAPIIEEDQVTEKQKRAMLAANFHTALDARYATSNGVLYAAFIHPLSPLTEEELASAIRQVATLARNFGTTYSSDELIYGGRRQDQ